MTATGEQQAADEIDRLLVRLTIGSVALRGTTTLDGGHSIQGFGDLRDAITQTAAITLGLIVGAVPVQAAAVRRRRPRRQWPAVGYVRGHVRVTPAPVGT